MSAAAQGGERIEAAGGRGAGRFALQLLLWGPALLMALPLLLPQEWLIGVLDHPAHPRRGGPPGAAPPADTTVAGARLLANAALPAAALWLAGAACLRLWTRRARAAPAAPGQALDPPPPRWVLPLLVLVAAALRLPLLTQSLWYDEIAALGDFTQYGPGAIAGAWFTPSNHVLQGILSWASLHLLDGGDVALRLPSFLAGLLLIPAVLGLGREAGGTRLGVVAAALASFMPIAALEATEARGYSLAMLMAALAGWGLLRGARTGHPAPFVAAALATALGVWAHMAFAAWGAGAGLVCLARLAWPGGQGAERARARLGAACGAAALLMGAALAFELLCPLLPDVLALREQLKGGRGQPTLLSAEGARIALTFTGTWAALHPWALLAAPGAIACAAGVAALLRRRTSWALLMQLAGVAVAVAGVALAGSWMYARFISWCVPGVCLLMGAGLLELGRVRRGAALAVAGALAAAWIWELTTLPPRQPLRDAMQWLQARRAPEERVGTVGIRGNVLAWYAPEGLAIATSGIGGSELEPMLERWQPRWIVVTYPRAMLPEARALLEERGFAPQVVLPGWVDWGGGDVEVWRRP